jgi:hypothetical protein
MLEHSAGGRIGQGVGGLGEDQASLTASQRIGMECECLHEHEPRARSAQRRRSQPAFIMIMIMKLVSVCVGSPAAKLSAAEPVSPMPHDDAMN